MSSFALNLGCGASGLGSLEIGERFRLTRELGLANLEIDLSAAGTGSPPPLFSTEQVAEIKEARTTHKIQTPSCSLTGELLPDSADELKREIDGITQQLDCASDLDIPIVTLWATQRPTVDTAQQHIDELLEALVSLQSAAQQRNLVLTLATRGGLETREDGTPFFIETLFTHREHLARLLEQMPSEIGITYEPGMIKAVNPNDLRFLIDVVGDRVKVCRCDDYRSENRALVPAVIGKDDLDYAPLIQQLPADIVYYLHTPDGDDPATALSEALHYLQQCTERNAV